LDLVLDLVPRALAPLDLVLLTGDLVHDESPEGYQYLKERMAALGAPCHCLPGNHDSSSIMADIFDRVPAKMGTSVQQGRWNLVLLDSTMPGEDGGHLDGDQLGHLQDSLARRPDDPALVCLHHQPVPVGSIWMDTMALDNPYAFFGIIDRHPQVRAILWGHVHQEFSGERKGVCLLGSPSTCVQFLPGSRDFALDTRTPGLRWLKLYGDGRIDTGVERIDSYPDPLVLTKSGY
jgi:Icc protein